MTEIISSKKCSCCGKILPLTEYYVRRVKNKPETLYASCKKCHSKKSMRWTKLHPKLHRQYIRKWLKSLSTERKEEINRKSLLSYHKNKHKYNKK